MSTSRIIHRNAGKSVSLAGENFDNKSERVVKSRSGGKQTRTRRDVDEVWNEVQAITRCGLGWISPAIQGNGPEKNSHELFDEPAGIGDAEHPSSNPTVSA